MVRFHSGQKGGEMKTWFISDNHFHHANILRFKGDDGNLIRPGFKDVEDMNEFMVEKWNSVVGENDKVYHLGDVVMKSASWAFEILDRLNGEKVLIRGNHDKAKLSVYAKYFKDVRSEIHMKTSEGDMVIFTHRPIRIAGDDKEFVERNTFNVHGHIHQNLIDDFRYINISVEVIDYTPITWHEIDKHILERKRLMEVRKHQAEHGVYV